MVSASKTRFAVLVVPVAFAGLLGCHSGTPTAEDAASDIQSIVGDNEAEDVATFLAAQEPDLKKEFARVFNAVGVLRLDGRARCTGWFVSRSHFVTNQHCVWIKDRSKEHPDVMPDEKVLHRTEGICERLSIHLDHQTGRSFDTFIGSADDSSDDWRTDSRRHGCAEIHVANQARDLAIVEIAGEADVEPLKLARTAPVGASAFIVGHPRGRPKKISYYNIADRRAEACRTREPSFPPGKGPDDAPNPYYGTRYPYSIVHTCDTQGGNSGSPLFSLKTRQVIGLHWDGWQSSKFPYYDPNGTDPDTSYYDRNGDVPGTYADDLPFRPGNVAIRIEEIRKFVSSAQVPSAVREIFR